ncbi:MAG: adenylosuccinate synthetase [Patescibacteria group bacterium]
MKADIIVDLQYGDSGKGKVAHFLCKTKKYTHVLRYNGGCNAGHTIFHKGKKFVTHHIPAGVFWGVRSIIGPGCVVDPVQFLKEIKMLEEGGINTKGKIFVATNAHVITEAHKHEDGGDKRIGTTKRGNGPAYRDKYARTGIRAEHVKALKPYLIDLYEEFHNNKKEVVILGEGAQGFGLDIDWGDYPFVTSSHCTTAGFLLNGVPPQAVREVWGVAKIYETYVGEKKFEPKDPVFKKLREIGEEFGATTGRPRQCNWLNVNLVERAIRINGLTHIVFNKMDVMREVGQWAVILNGKRLRFKGEKEMKAFLTKRLKALGILPSHVYFSEDKEGI